MIGAGCLSLLLDFVEVFEELGEFTLIVGVFNVESQRDVLEGV